MPLVHDDLNIDKLWELKGVSVLHPLASLVGNSVNNINRWNVNLHNIKYNDVSPLTWLGTLLWALDFHSSNQNHAEHTCKSLSRDPKVKAVINLKFNKTNTCLSRDTIISIYIYIYIYIFLDIWLSREYSTYRVVTTSRLKAKRHLVVHDNLKTFTK